MARRIATDDEDEVDLVVMIWGSQENLRRYVYRVAHEFCARAFRSAISPPEINVWVRLGPAGVGQQVPSAAYSSGPPPHIYLCRRGWANRKRVRLAVAHELIHHWEHVADEAARSREDYPEAIDPLIAAAFYDWEAERRWRAHHSPRFLAKVAEVAEVLRLPLASLIGLPKRLSRRPEETIEDRR